MAGRAAVSAASVKPGSSSTLYFGDRIAIGALTALCLVRFLGAGTDFSYDYAFYIHYLWTVATYSAPDLLASFRDYAPYVFVTTGGTFEAGFVSLSAATMTIVQDATIAYAALAAAAIALRLWAMRSLRVPWPWVLLAQVYAVTLFDANALRAGLAVSAVLVGIAVVARGHPVAGSIVVSVAALFHLQSVVFAAPFILSLFLLRHGLNSRIGATLLVAASLGGGLVTLLGLPYVDVARVNPYIGNASTATGLTLTSISATIALVVAVASRVISPRHEVDDPSSHLWDAVLVAGIPAVVILIGGASYGAIGDRIWQFAFTVVLAAVWLPAASDRGRTLVRLALLATLVVAVTNVTIRFPQSNFFDFVLPHENIVPSFSD